MHAAHLLSGHRAAPDSTRQYTGPSPPGRIDTTLPSLFHRPRPRLRPCPSQHYIVTAATTCTQRDPSLYPLAGVRVSLLASRQRVSSTHHFSFSRLHPNTQSLPIDTTRSRLPPTHPNRNPRRVTRDASTPAFVAASFSWVRITAFATAAPGSSAAFDRATATSSAPWLYEASA